MQVIGCGIFEQAPADFIQGLPDFRPWRIGRFPEYGLESRFSQFLLPRNGDVGNKSVRRDGDGDFPDEVEEQRDDEDGQAQQDPFEFPVTGLFPKRAESVGGDVFNAGQKRVVCDNEGFYN